MQQTQPNSNYIPQPSFNTNYMQQSMPNPKDISDPTTTMNMALILMAKAFKLNYYTPTNNQRTLSNSRNMQIAQPGNQNGYNAVQNVRNQFVQTAEIANQNVNQTRNGNVVAARAKDQGETQLLIAQKEEGRIQLQAKEFDLMAVTGDIDEIKEVNANCILMANLQQASTSGTQIDKAFVYDSDGSAEDLHEIDYIQLYDFLKFNQVEVDAIRAERLARTHDPLALMANSHNPYSYLVFH
ncbi:hypothetical protein Tco_0818061 [Tanacetum coccineum]